MTQPHILTLRNRLRDARLEDFAVAFAQNHGASLNTLLAGVRYSRYSTLRAELAALLRWTLGLSLPEVGNLLGLDHTSVLHCELRRGAELEALHPGASAGEWTRNLQERKRKRKEWHALK